MKHLSKVCAAVVGMAGCMGNCMGTDSDAATQLAKYFEQTLKCELKATVKIEFNGKKDEFSLFDDKGAPNPALEIPFTIEGFDNTKMKIEYTADDYEYSDGGKFMIKQKLVGKSYVKVPEGDGASFVVKVVDATDASKAFIFDNNCVATLDNKNIGTKSEYKINIQAIDPEKGTTQFGTYKTSTLKFTFISE